MAGRDQLLAGNFQKAGGHGWHTGELDLWLRFRRARFRDEVPNSMGWFLAAETDPRQVLANRETAAEQTTHKIERGRARRSFRGGSSPPRELGGSVLVG